MLIAAVALMAIGSLGVGAAVLLEIKTHEPVWKLMMKIFPWVLLPELQDSLQRKRG